MLALTRLAAGMAAIGQRPQLDYGEPIIYSHAARIPNGEALYQPLDRAPFTVAAYTPLYYTLAAELQVRVGPGFGPGRAVSYAAGLATGLGVAWLAARSTRSVWAGLFAALLFLGLGFPGTVPWFALYRVDMLAEALSLGAIVVLAHGTTARHALVAGVLAGLAILTKQSYLAAALAGAVWLGSLRPRCALLFGATSLGLAGLVGGAEERATGAFLANVVVANANPLNLEQAVGFAGLFAQTLGAPLAIAVVHVASTRPWRQTPTRLLLLYWLASALPLVGLLKFGASYNYWVEFAASTAVLATLGLWSPAARQAGGRLASRGLAWLLTLAIAVAAPAPVTVAATWLSGGSVAGIPDRATTDEFQALVEFVRTRPGLVLADPLDVLVLGGRPVLLEPVVFALLADHGQWNADVVVRRICAGDVSLLVLGAPLDTIARYAPNGQPWWPPRVMRALQARMQPAAPRAGRFLYVPATSAMQANRPRPDAPGTT